MFASSTEGWGEVPVVFALTAAVSAAAAVDIRAKTAAEVVETHMQQYAAVQPVIDRHRASGEAPAGAAAAAAAVHSCSGRSSRSKQCVATKGA
jgi:hypothetical protein